MKKLLPLLFLLVVPPVPVPAQADEIPESVRETPVVRAVRLVRDSVVSIETETRVRVLAS